MRTPRSFKLAALALPLALAGCSYFIPTKRRLPVPRAPLVVQAATADQLVDLLNKRWDGFRSLTATVEIYATEMHSNEGMAKDFPSCRGYIVIQKPSMLRVAGTYFGVKIFDMASDGDRFTLVIPQKNTAIRGTNMVHEKSSNQMENLRPNFFLDAMVARGLNDGEEYMVAGDSETVEDAAKKHLYAEPEYVLSVMRRKAGSRELMPVRVITFHRDDLLPYDQDLYDSAGNLETQIIYRNYTDYTAGKYPSQVTIRRPQEGIQLVLDVIRVQENVNLPAGEFEVAIPPDMKVRDLK